MSLFSYTELQRVALSFSESSGVNRVFSKDAKNIHVPLADRFDIFLSHSYGDKEIIPKLKKLLESFGYSVYVDWITDHLLDRGNVNKYTAEVLQQRMKQCKCLLYATSDNSSNSRWMPWELGYFDGIKDKKVAILPLKKSTNSFKDNFEGEEYLGLYYFVDKENGKLFINESQSVHVSFDQWLRGAQPMRYRTP